MKKISTLLIVLMFPLVSYSQFVLNSGSYTQAQILSGLGSCGCTEVHIADGADVDMNGSWDLTSAGDIIVRIVGSGSLIFSGNGNNDELILTDQSLLLIDDKSNRNSILNTANGGQTRVNIGGTTYKGNDFNEIIDAGGADSAGPLPIKLKSFTASKSAKNISLDWVTAKEENFSHFEIERSIDQNNWEQIGMVQGLGESNSDVKYDFTDRGAPFGVIYYRLKAVDIDATFEYSSVVKIEVGFEGKLAVSPNPVKDASNLKIQVPSEFREDLAYVGLFDLSGVRVQEFRNFKTDGTLQINQKLKSGMYILKVNHNGLQENIRVIVQ
ncbi:T9SS type A sorting domain-containing protein [Marivirga tractuosa]|uniref:T9SS type A sorting domain-containing protein n=1 Tax=Marivirga tractuosa TaxID=1006 RepID=UPI0035CEDE6F